MAEQDLKIVYESNARFVAEHARHVSLAIGAARAMEYHGRLLQLRGLKWIQFGPAGRCPMCISCCAKKDGTDFCKHCEFLHEIWPQLGEKGKPLMIEYLTVKTQPDDVVRASRPVEGKTDTTGRDGRTTEERPPSQWD